VFKKFLLIALMLFGMAAFAYAQTDDDASPAADDDASAEPFSLTGTANGTSPPVVLQASTVYAFAFDVFNTGGGTEAIKQVDITLPNASYSVDQTKLKAPAAKHADRGAWTVTYASDTATITWLFQGTVSSAELGDIEQGEDLVFPFSATTDAAATDGFTWTLTGDAGTVVGPDVFYFNNSQPSPDDDESPVPHPGSNSSSGGCGC
jgi:hypothetical protein